jgi:hypothetical protein
LTFETRGLGRGLLLVGGLLAVGIAPQAVGAQALNTIEGAWSADRYILADGTDHEVRGRIFFADRDWQVLFFVMDESGVPRRGSAEGGRYTLEGNSLSLTHEFNLSGGDGLPGLPRSDFSLTVRPESAAVLEPTTTYIEGDRFTLYFPSGNRMTFRRR